MRDKNGSVRDHGPECGREHGQLQPRRSGLGIVGNDRSWEGNLAMTQERLTPLAESILKDHRINNLPAEDTPPPGKLLAHTVELFKYHDPATSMTLHVDRLLP